MEYSSHMFGMLMLYAAYHGPATFDDRFGRWDTLRPRPGIVLFDPRPIRTVPVRVRPPLKSKGK